MAVLSSNATDDSESEKRTRAAETVGSADRQERIYVTEIIVPGQQSLNEAWPQKSKMPWSMGVLPCPTPAYVPVNSFVGTCADDLGRTVHTTRTRLLRTARFERCPTLPSIPELTTSTRIVVRQPGIEIFAIDRTNRVDECPRNSLQATQAMKRKQSRPMPRCTSYYTKSEKGRGNGKRLESDFRL